MCAKNQQSGITLIEILMFIVIVGISVSGLLAVINNSARHGADPMVAKQATVIAEALLTEIEQMPFTWCDPNDVNVTIAANAAGCALPANDQNNGGGALGPIPAGETRGSAVNPFDNVSDYHGFAQNPVPLLDAAGAVIPGYTSTVAVCRWNATPCGGVPVVIPAFPGPPAADAVLRIQVLVTGPNNTRIMVVGYRARYAPNAPG